MYWHIDTDIISLIVIFAIYIYNSRVASKDESSMQSRSFMWCLRAGIIVTIIDIVASVIMEVPVSSFVYHLFMTLYFLSIEFVIVLWFIYSLNILYCDDKKKLNRFSLLICIPYFIYALIACLNPWTGMIYTLGLNNEYLRGEFFYLTLAFYAFYALALFIVVLFRHKHTPKNYSAGILMLIPLILAASIVVQLTNPGWLMIVPAYMVSMVIAFLFLQTRQTRDNQVLVKNLSKAALTDPLTGLYNRAGMEGIVQNSLTNQLGEQCLVAVVDIDDLKSINDILGHPEGDRAIQIVGNVLKQHFCPLGIVARFGGDEFVIYSIGEMTELQAHRFLKLLLDKINSLQSDESCKFSIRISIGAVVSRVGRDKFEILCARADTALYHVKQQGKNGYAFYEPDMETEVFSENNTSSLPVS